MTRTTLDTQLHVIRTRIIRLGTLVEMALEQSIQSVQNGDKALCGLVIAADDTIDEVCSEVERLAFQSLTLHIYPASVSVCSTSPTSIASSGK